MLNKIIFRLQDLSHDLAILELDESDAASRRVRAALIEVSSKEIPDLKNEIANIRAEAKKNKKSNNNQ